MEQLVPLTTGIADDAHIPRSEVIVIVLERHRAPLIVGNVDLCVRVCVCVCVCVCIY